jgi:hypothetical protein
VVFTVKPVTQVAEVAVNKASKRDVLSPVALASGNISKTVPINIVKK